jgi:hypothetical protein
LARKPAAEDTGHSWACGAECSTAVVLRGSVGSKEEDMFNHGYSLLIGVDQNKIADLALPIVKKDVTKLKEVITHPDRCGYSEENVRLLSGTEATRSNILDGLDWLKESLLADKDANQTA